MKKRAFSLVAIILVMAFVTAEATTRFRISVQSTNPAPVHHHEQRQILRSRPRPNCGPTSLTGPT